MAKKLTKEKIRKLEENKKKRKKMDYRKFANQMFKDPSKHLPLIIGGSGSGPGKKAYCYDCKETPRVTKYKEGIIFCGNCGGTFVEMRDKYPRFWTQWFWDWKQIQYNLTKTYNLRENNE